MKSIVCIVCPKGCRLQVDENQAFAVTGNGCKRGIAYGREEAEHPARVLTSTVKVTNAQYRRCPVKLTSPIPKELISQAMSTLQGVCLHAPVQQGMPVVKNVCGTGVNFVTTRAMEATHNQPSEQMTIPVP